MTKISLAAESFTYSNVILGLWEVTLKSLFYQCSYSDLKLDHTEECGPG